MEKYETIWKLDDHTAAKHDVLRAYLEAWIPIMGHAALKYGGDEPRLLLVDGFAGPGRYSGGEPGSPLIMLEALLEHKALPQLDEVQFFLYFIEQDGARVESLEREVGKLQLPANVTVVIEQGMFEDKFEELVTVEDGHHLIPTFAFIDPFGYTQANMSLTGRLLEFPRTEALFFLPFSDICRFLSKPDQAAGLDALFGTDRWREAIPLEGEDRTELLMDILHE
jgi:three-Cys-motif partner protein